MYAIWHFGPALKVSMDGRRETVYTEATIEAHRRFYDADATALPYLRQLNPDYIWVPARLNIASRLPAAGWTPVFTGPISIVFSHSATASLRLIDDPPPTARCFPGP